MRRSRRGSEQKQCCLFRASICDLVKHHFINDGAVLLTLLKMLTGTLCVLANAHGPQHQLSTSSAPLLGREKFPQMHSLQTHVLFRSH